MMSMMWMRDETLPADKDIPAASFAGLPDTDVFGMRGAGAGGAGRGVSYPVLAMGLCTLNQVDPYPIAYNLSKP